MTIHDLINRLGRLNPEMQVILWDTKKHRFTSDFAVEPSPLEDEVLITPLSEPLPKAKPQSGFYNIAATKSRPSTPPGIRCVLLNDPPDDKDSFHEIESPGFFSEPEIAKQFDERQKFVLPDCSEADLTVLAQMLDLHEYVLMIQAIPQTDRFRAYLTPERRTNRPVMTLGPDEPAELVPT